MAIGTENGRFLMATVHGVHLYVALPPHIQNSFPVIHKVGNVGIFILLV